MGSRPFTRASGEPAIVAGFARIQSQPADALQLLFQHNKEQVGQAVPDIRIERLVNVRHSLTYSYSSVSRAPGEPAIVAGFARIQSQPADALQLLLQHNKEQPVGPKRAFPFNDKPAGDRVWSGLNTDACRLIVKLRGGRPVGTGPTESVLASQHLHRHRPPTGLNQFAIRGICR